MRIALAQIDTHIGNFAGNLQSMQSAIAQAREQGADLICFPELAVCGYPPRDFLEFADFIELAQASIQALVPLSADIAIVVGCPSPNPVIEGKDLYNSAYFLADGQIRHVQHKTLLPTYDIFDEYRYFEPASTHDVVEFRGLRIALSICEDIWNVGNENPLYTICPLDEMMPQKPDLILNLSASPFSYRQATERLHVLRHNVERYQLPIVYVNQVGAQTEILFDGGSVAMRSDGTVCRELPYFQELVTTVELDDLRGSGPSQEQPKPKGMLIHDALVMGIRDYFAKLGFRQAILGLSGGLDSALTAVLAARALGPENVTALLMPSQFSSDHSLTDAQQLVNNLGIRSEVIAIEPGYRAMQDLLAPHFADQPFNIAEENIQARIRGMLLMAFSNKFGPILLNTTNKSEMAVGYGTLYGDLCGGLSVIGDIYKTEVFALAREINQDQEVIPWHTITKPPSAELRPDQKDTDSLPDYDILDPILYHYIEERLSPQDIIEKGYDETLVRRILKLVNQNEFKRYQTAPVLRVSPKAFGMGRRMPIVAKYLG